jgi:hypothetical protein
MIDVRLTATNPEDSTLVPVPCNERGELLTVAPKIEKIPNDVEIDGDLTINGLINGRDPAEPGPPGPPGEPGEPGEPGPNVLLPYGPEYSYLSIKGGVPQWVLSNNEPNPPGPPSELMIGDTRDETFELTRNFGSWGLNEALVLPPDPWDAYVRTLPTWETPGPQKMGIGGRSADNEEINFEFDMNLLGGFDKLLQITMTFQYEGLQDSYSRSHITESRLIPDNENLVAITDNFELRAEYGTQTRTLQHVLLPMRPDIGLVRFTARAIKSEGWSGSLNWAFIQRWEYIDASKYLLQRMAKAKQLITTTDIDLSRPTQD